MIKAILSDFSETILFPKDETHHHDLNGLHTDLTGKIGEYDAWKYFYINEELLNFFKSLKNQCALYVFTSDAIQGQTQIKAKLDEVFIRVFSAKEYNLNKRFPDSYTFIANTIKQNPSDILFIDDQEVNLEAAKKAGLQIIHFKDNQTLFKEIQKFIIK